MTKQNLKRINQSDCMKTLLAVNGYGLLTTFLLLLLCIPTNARRSNVGVIDASEIYQGMPRWARIHATIKTTAEKLAESDSAIIKVPVFNYVDETKQLEYNLGGVRIEALEFETEDVYLMPFEKQIQVEALRKLFSRVVPQESFWQLILDQIEQVIIATVRDIESIPIKSRLPPKLASRTDQVNEVLAKLHEAIRLYAQSKGYTARRVGRGLASDTFTVEVIKTPNNGRVQVLPWVKYVKCAVLGKCGNNWRWRELVSERENMIGEYYYQAEWPGGGRNEGQIDIRNNTTVTFRPRE